MSLTIIGGTLIYGRTVQPAQYETKKAEVHLQFNVPEGQTITAEQIEEVAKLAMTKTHEMVGLAKPAAKEVKDAAANATSVPQTGRTKADLEAEAVAAASQPKPDKAAKQPPKSKAADKPKSDPAAIEGGEKPQINTNPENRQDPAQADAAAIDESLFAPAEEGPITEAKLIEACTAKMKALNNAVPIRTVIAKYVAAPKTVKDIPEASRAQFLKDLENL